MIVAYHNTHVVYAYKGMFNRNIDYNWTGGILLDFKKIVDKCTVGNVVQPAPIYSWPYSRYKKSPYQVNSGGSLITPEDCHWHDCHLPSSISESKSSVKMTGAIFVR